ncbi:MAG: acyl-CoA dehydrogenase family protein, partial [Pseudomonadota bacterium]
MADRDPVGTKQALPGPTGGDNPFDFDRRYKSPAYTEDHDAWRATLRRFVEAEIIPHIDDWEEAGTFPRDLYTKAAVIGLLGLGFPEEWGGTPVNDPYFGLVTAEEMARTGSGGINAGLLIHSIGLPPLLAGGSPDLIADIAPKVLAGEKIIALGMTEPDGGSDLANLKTKAIRDGDDYLVSGSKTYITSGMRADYVSTAVRTGGPGYGGVSMLLIDMGLPGVDRTSLKKQGWWCSDTATLYFDQVRVPAANLLGRENAGFAIAMQNFNGER